MPGSHLWPELPEDKPEVESVAATGPAGTMLMFDGRLWHGTGANRTSRRRHLLLGYFCRPWIRPQEIFTLSLLDELYEELRRSCSACSGSAPTDAGHRERGDSPQPVADPARRTVGPMEGTWPPAPE